MDEAHNIIGLFAITLWGVVTFVYLRHWRARKTARQRLAKRRPL